MNTPIDSQAAHRTEVNDGWRRLVDRWFVEFNPLYLLSAALVLGGCFLLSQGIAEGQSLWATLGITGVSEVYALSLAGGAALLMRIGRRRPAVILASLLFLYLWDLTLHTETSAYLGTAGAWAVGGWLAAFAGKIAALGRAMRVRFSGRVVAASMLAGVGLAVGPRLVGDLGARHAGELITVWAFTLGALYRSRGGIESVEELTPWGQTVLERATRAAWRVGGGLVGAHVLFWSTTHAIALPMALPIVPLLAVRGVRSEKRAWGVVAGTLVLVALAMPGGFAMTALLAAGALVLRAFSPGFSARPAAPVGPVAAEPPYRASGMAPSPLASVPVGPAIIGYAERVRAVTGAAACLYLAAWTWGWSGGVWPAHVLLLDAALTVAALLAMAKSGTRSPLWPLAACYAHLALQVVPVPRSALQWGATSVTLGFALLFGSLAVSYRFRRPDETRARDGVA